MKKRIVFRDRPLTPDERFYHYCTICGVWLFSIFIVYIFSKLS